MKYLPYVGLTILVLVSGAYALKARSIRDYLLNWMAKIYGSESLTYRLSKSFMGNSFYVASVSIVSAIVAICSLAVLIYLLVIAYRSSR
jgi:hypothetical protein